MRSLAVIDTTSVVFLIVSMIHATPVAVYCNCLMFVCGVCMKPGGKETKDMEKSMRKESRQ